MGDAATRAAEDARRRDSAEAGPQPVASTLTDRSMAVAVITLARYLVLRDPGAVTYLQDALEQARAANLLEADLATLRLIVRAVGGA